MTAYEGRPAGCGALYVEDGIAWLDWGATAPDFRGLNGQSALLRRRIIHALDLGCRLLATCTGEEVPGDPQISYRNITKMGFAIAYTRRNMAPPKLAAG
jgi:GNAT superfamily N-acetyltransferase